MNRMLTKSDLEKIRAVTSELIFEGNKSLKNELKEEIILFKDAILGEIKNLREEVTIVTGYKDQIEDHETRIEKLEHTVHP